jgi:hypothetical protein
MPGALGVGACEDTKLDSSFLFRIVSKRIPALAAIPAYVQGTHVYGSDIFLERSEKLLRTTTTTISFMMSRQNEPMQQRVLSHLFAGHLIDLMQPSHRTLTWTITPDGDSGECHSHSLGLAE